MLKKIPLQFRGFFILFFCAWIFFGLTTNKSDLEEYTLPQVAIRAIVEYNTFSLAVKKLPVRDTGYDRFYHGGKILAAKQPGLFALGSLPYYASSRLGITYENNYYLAARLVTLFTSSLFSALAVAFIFLLLNSIWKFSKPIAYFTSISYGAATTILPYSGVTHHDIVAVSYLFIAFCLIEKNNYSYKNRNVRLSVLSGFLLGLTIFTSMLPALVVAALLVYILFSKNWNCILYSGIGFIVGILPLAVYNVYYLGDLLGQSYVAAGYKDTVSIKFNNMGVILHHINFYFALGWSSILKYMPIVIPGVLGFFCMGKKFGKQKILFLSLITVHSLYLINIPTYGHCQYGPRYLIPTIPFIMLGLAFLLKWASIERKRMWVVYGVMILGIYSFGVNLLGALYGTMYCDYDGISAIVSHFNNSWQANKGLLVNWCIYFYLGVILLWFFRAKFRREQLGGLDDKIQPLKSEKEEGPSGELLSKSHSQDLINPEAFTSRNNVRRSFICIIILIAVMNIARFMNLEDSPPGFYVDEAAVATSIQCLAEEGTDALGNPYPLFAEAWDGNVRPPIQLYFGVLWAKLFGTSIASFRATSAFFTLLTIAGLFLLSSLFFNRRCAVFVALAASISPWAFHTSRVPWELSMTSFFIVWGIYFFLRKDRFLNMFLSGLFLACATYCYQTAKAQVPLLLFPLLFLKWKRHGLKIKPIMLFFITLIGVAIPLISATLNGELQGRFSYLIIFSDSYMSSLGREGTILDFIIAFFQNLIPYFNPTFLFLTGDTNLRHSTQFTGQLSWLDSFALIFGAGYLIKSICELEEGEGFRAKSIEILFVIFVLVNIVIGIVPAALTGNAGLPHAFRSAGAWPFISLLTGYVLWKATEKWKYVFVVVLIISITFSYKYLSHYYFVYPRMSQNHFDAGIKDAALATREQVLLKNLDEDVSIIDPENPWDQFIWRYWEYYPLAYNGLHLRYYLMNYRGETCSESRKDYESYKKIFFPILSDKEHNNRGIVLAQRKNLNEAVKHFSEAIRMNPDYAEAYRNLGTTWISLGQNQKALDSLSRAYEILIRTPEENVPLIQNTKEMIEGIKQNK